MRGGKKGVVDGGRATLLPSTNATLLSASCPGHRCTATTLCYNVRMKNNGMQQKCTDGGCIVCNLAGQGEIQLKPWLQLKPTKYTPLLYHTAQNTDSLMFDHFTVLNPTLQQLPALNSARCCRRQHGDVELESN